jgi:hypothetical protein
MGILRDRLFGLSAVVLFLSGTVLLVVLGYGAVVLYSALVTGSSLVGVLVELALPGVLVVGLLLVGVVFGALGSLYAVARNATLPRGGRVQRLAEYVEDEYPPLRALGLSEAVAEPEPSPEEKAEDALAELKRQYVAGEIDEREFEEKVDRLVATDSVEEARAVRERHDVLREN